METADPHIHPKLMVYAWATALFRDRPGFDQVDFSPEPQEVVEELNRRYGKAPNIMPFNLRWEMLSGKLAPHLIEGVDPGDDTDFIVMRSLILGHLGTAACVGPFKPSEVRPEDFERECVAAIRKLPLPVSGTKVVYHGRRDRRTLAAITWREHPDGRACTQFWCPPGNEASAAAVFMHDAYRRYLNATHP